MWGVAEFIARWSAFAAMFALAVLVEIAAFFFEFAEVVAGLVATWLIAAVDWLETRMFLMVWPKDE
jgi:hypothetical protein